MEKYIITYIDEGIKNEKEVLALNELDAKKMFLKNNVNCTIVTIQKKTDSDKEIKLPAKNTNENANVQANSNKKRKIILIAIVISVLFVISVTICYNIGKSIPDSSNTPGITETKQNKINTVVDIYGACELTVTGVKNDKKIGLINGVKTENNFVVLTVKIKNTMQLQGGFSPKSFVYYQNKTAYFYHEDATIACSNGLYNTEIIGPEITKTYKIVFETPSTYSSSDFLSYEGVKIYMK